MTDIAIVSAAASGIGAATVRRLLTAGWHVIAVDIDGERLRTLGAQQVVAGDARHETTWQQVRELVDAAVGVRRLALVAGVGGAIFRASQDMTDDEWYAMFELNLMSAVRPVRALLPSLLAAERGLIVTIGSLSGRRSEPTTPAYCAFKAAVDAWTSALALELAQTNVRVNCVLPGVTDTEGLRGNLARKGQTLDDLADRARRQPRGRLLDPAEVAAVIAFLLTDEASGLLATSLVVDGGLSRRLPG